jgi:hypothetical protein
VAIYSPLDVVIGRLTVDNTDPEWNLHRGTGVRVTDKFIRWGDGLFRDFNTGEELSAARLSSRGVPAAVFVNLVGFHIRTGQDARLETSIGELTSDGMEIVIRTEGNTRVDSVAVEDDGCNDGK